MDIKKFIFMKVEGYWQFYSSEYEFKGAIGNFR